MIRTPAGIDHAISRRYSVAAAVVLAIAVLAIALALMGRVGVPPIFGAALLISVFLLTTLVSGLKAATGYVSDWLCGSNRASATAVGMVLAAGILSGPLMITLAGLFMEEANLSGPSLLIGSMLGLALFTVTLAPYLRNSGAVSPASLIGARFNHTVVRVMATISVGLLCLLLLWAQLRTGAMLARLYFGLAEMSGAIGLAVLVAAMMIPGGQYGIIRSNVIFYTTIAVTFLLPLVWLGILGATIPVPQLAVGVAALSELDALESQLRDLGVSIFTDGMETGWPNLSHGFSLVVPLLALCAGFITLPGLLGATQATRNANSARRSGMLALIYTALVVTAAPAAAAFARLGIYENIMGLPAIDVAIGAGWAIEWSAVASLNTGSPLVRLCGETVRTAQEVVAACGGNPDHLIGPDDFAINGELPAYAMAQMTGLPGMLSMLAAAGLFAAVLSTANAAAFMAAVTVGDGLRGNGGGRHPPANFRLFLLRAAGIAMLAVAAALAVLVEISPIDLTLWAIAVAASLAPVLMATVWSDRLDRNAVLCGCVVPLLVLALFGLFEFLSPEIALHRYLAAIDARMPLQFQAGFAGFISAALVILALTFMPGGTSATSEALNRIRTPGEGAGVDRPR